MEISTAHKFKYLHWQLWDECSYPFFQPQASLPIPLMNKKLSPFFTPEMFHLLLLRRNRKVHGHIFNAEKYVKNSTDVSTRDFWHEPSVDSFHMELFLLPAPETFQVFQSPPALSSGTPQVFPEKFCTQNCWWLKQNSPWKPHKNCGCKWDQKKRLKCG